MPKKCQDIYAVVCADGRVFSFSDGVFENPWDAEEFVEDMAHSGWSCNCKDHRVVRFSENQPKKIKGKSNG